MKNTDPFEDASTGFINSRNEPRGGKEDSSSQHAL